MIDVTIHSKPGYQYLTGNSRINLHGDKNYK